MILEMLWCLIFTPLIIPLGWVKMGCVPFLPQVCLVFTPNHGVKMGHLSKQFSKNCSPVFTPDNYNIVKI